MICDSVPEVILSSCIIAENGKKGNRFLAGQDLLRLFRFSASRQEKALPRRIFCNNAYAADRKVYD